MKIEFHFHFYQQDSNLSCVVNDLLFLFFSPVDHLQISNFSLHVLIPTRQRKINRKKENRISDEKSLMDKVEETPPPRKNRKNRHFLVKKIEINIIAAVILIITANVPHVPYARLEAFMCY